MPGKENGKRASRFGIGTTPLLDPPVFFHDMSEPQPVSYRPVIAVIVLILAAYVACAFLGVPQRASQQGIVPASTARAASTGTPEAIAAQHEAIHKQGSPPLFMVAPFVLLLLAIAILPLVSSASHWWESNLHKFYVAAGLGVLTLGYYAIGHEHPVTMHWPTDIVVAANPIGMNWATTGAVVVNAMVFEFIPFIILLLTLYTIAGGIRIAGDLQARPATNAAFMGIGAVLANLIGTTGAAMLLIRPLLETNRERKHVAHTVVFFIFSVCNCGGLLTPLGDPPLFLGYLLGVPFLYTLSLWPQWLFVNGMIVAIYFFADRLFYYPHEEPVDRTRDATRQHRLHFAGLWPNGVLLLGVVLSIALLDPGKPLPGTQWHPWVFLREAIQLGLILVSLALGHESVRRANRFNFGAILEVSALFFGIFLCMQPALQILHEYGPSLGLSRPVHFFWASGSLSSFLDNAPTYVVFFETARSLGGGPAIAGVQVGLLAAVSLGSVFMGAMTYIGNGPNFMVKAIAEQSGVTMPSFFGYMVYSLVVLLPLFGLVTWLFLR